MRNVADQPRDPHLLGSPGKGPQVIDRFTQRSSWSLAERASTSQRSKPTSFRIRHTLEDVGHVQKNPNAGRRAPVLRCHAIGVDVLCQHETICVQAVDGTRPARIGCCPGKRSPVHASAPGMVPIAWLSRHERTNRLSRPATFAVDGHQSRRVAHRPAAGAKPGLVRNQGWAMDNKEIKLGLCCLGAPITGQRGHGLAAVAISAPATRMQPARIEDLTARVQDTAQRISCMPGNATTQRAATNAA